MKKIVIILAIISNVAFSQRADYQATKKTTSPAYYSFSEFGTKVDANSQPIKYGFKNIYWADELGIIPGVAFNNTTFASALAAVPSGGTLRFSNGNYIYNGNNTVSITKSINIVFENNSSIDLTGASLDQKTFLQISGSAIARESLSDTLYEGANYVIVSSGFASACSRGTIILLTSSIVWDGAGTKWKGAQGIEKGEYNEVHYVSGDTLYFFRRISEGYGTTCKIQRMTFYNVNIDGMHIIGTAAQRTTMLRLNYCKNSELKNINIQGCGLQAIFISNCYKTNISNCTLSDLIYQTNVGTGNDYGIVLDDCTDGIITNCNVYGGRHAIDISGTYMPTRNIIVDNCILSNLTTAGTSTFSTHPACERVKLSNSVIYGGAGFRNPNWEVSGCTFYLQRGISQSTSIGGTINGICDFAIIKNNTINNAAGISASITLGTATVKIIDISGNTINSHGRTIKIESTGSGTVSNVSVTNNSITIYNNYALPSEWLFTTASNYTIDKLSVVANNVNTLASSGETALSLYNGVINDMFISSNNIHGHAYYLYQDTTDCTVGRAHIVSNNFKANQTTSNKCNIKCADWVNFSSNTCNGIERSNYVRLISPEVQAEINFTPNKPDSIIVPIKIEER